MIVGIMQPYFFPYLGYWQLINAVDKYVIYDDVTFIKGGWISRNYILLNGQAHMVTLPLENPSSFRKINDIDVTYNIKAREKIIKLITAAYKKAPYFDTIMPWIESLVLNSKGIAELNYDTIVRITDYLDIKTELIVSSDMDKDNSLTGQDKVIAINKALNSDTYINSVGGKGIYSERVFEENGIKLRFLEVDNVKYQQFNNEFVPNLSIIDVLMFNSVDETKMLLEQYSLSRGNR